MDEEALAATAEETVATTANTFRKTFADTLGATSLSSVLSALLVFLICLVFIRIVTRITERLIRGTKLDDTLKGFCLTAVRAVLWAMAIIICAGALGIPTASLVALVSVIGLALSLSVQNIMSNLFSGMTLLITKPFAAGDYVTIGESSGTVRTVGLFYTVLDTLDNKRVSIPNSDVTAASLVNFSKEPLRRVDFTFSASYDSPTGEVKAAVLQAAAGDERILSDPAPPCVLLSKFGESSIEYIVRVWCKNEDYWDVYYGMNERVRESFNERGVVMTYNHLNIHMIKENDV